MPRLPASASEAAEGKPATRDKVLVREGDVIADRYQLEELIGKGGMGEVWRARHKDLNTHVAIKLASRAAADMSERLLARFRFEAQLSAQLSRDCEQLVAVHDFGRHGEVAYLVMEYVPGQSLEGLIDEHGRLGVERMAAILEQVAVALEAAHAAGIWHRDIKPANVLISERHGRDLVKLADFGVAKAIEVRNLKVDAPHTTEWGILVGTPEYMSPEQIAGITVDARSDLWSLAVCVYEALTGRPPFDETEIRDLLVAIATKPIDAPSQHATLPRAVDEWFERALCKKPEARFGSATDMATAFRQAIAEPAKPPAKLRMPPRWMVAVIVVLAAAAIVLGLSLGRNDVDEASTLTDVAPTSAPAPAPIPYAAERDPSRTPSPIEPTSPTAPAPKANQAPRSRPASSATPSPSSSTHVYNPAETL